MKEKAAAYAVRTLHASIYDEEQIAIIVNQGTIFYLVQYSIIAQLCIQLGYGSIQKTWKPSGKILVVFILAYLIIGIIETLNTLTALNDYGECGSIVFNGFVLSITGVVGSLIIYGLSNLILSAFRILMKSNRD